jgi:uncharacterized protein YggE
MKLPCFLAAAAAIVLATPAFAQSTSGPVLVVPASGEVVRTNDLATATFSIEEQDKDKAVAASRVNQKMKEGMAVLRAADAQAVLKTVNYYTFPVYAEQPRGPGSVSVPAVKPVAVGWRVSQSVQLKTTNLAGLPKTAAAAQGILSLNGVSFGLAPATLKKSDDERIAATYANLRERIASMAAAMGRSPADAVLDTIDFEGSGNYTSVQVSGRSNQLQYSARELASPAAPAVAEPSFEPGETTLQMKVIGKVRFK